MAEVIEGGAWSSTHIIAIEPSEHGQFLYDVVTTLFLDVDAAFKRVDPIASDAAEIPDEGDEGNGKRSTVRFSGFVAHGSKRFFSSRRLSTLAPSLVIPHITIIGQHIQTVENRLRDVVSAVYFGKSQQIVSELRVVASSDNAGGGTAGEDVGVPKPHRMLTAVDSAPPPREQQPVPETVVAAVDGEETKRKHKKKSKERLAEHPVEEQPLNGAAANEELPLGWEAYQDNEGNTYYSNCLTGETSWELPTGNVPGDSGLSDNAAGLPQTVLDVFSSLTLSGSAEVYAKALRKGELRLKTKEELLALHSAEGGPDAALTPYIEVFGDRRKIVKWIAKQFNGGEAPGLRAAE